MDNVIVKTIGGQEVGFKFSMLTLKKYSAKQQLEFYELFEQNKNAKHVNIFSSYIALFQCAIAVYNKGDEPNEYEVDDLISDMEQGDLQDIWECCEQSYKDIVERVKARNTEKKTSAGTK